ncbi:aminopeptidase [Neptunitalea chrysea]|uniref:Aminopeptidase n=1 Tax=Neptunitalea chrysea TaxID=1647581 RepID=A0A9W6B791_9FLAO|nr:DUF805 domain-containing protein [Neptunitalea chrysea]GLB52529.1 aminopeptidase [Neptunitalea chrysea]
MDWYLKVLRQYVDFKGRARRQEYWMFILFNIIFSIVAAILDMLLGTGLDDVGVIRTLYSLVVFLPGFAVAVRRLHDVGKSGWMCLVGLIPLVGAIWLIVLMATDGEPGENKWGPNPKEVA